MRGAAPHEDSSSAAEKPAHLAAALRAGFEWGLRDGLPSLELAATVLALILVGWHGYLLRDMVVPQSGHAT
jgi:hypothetical protein